ncbi:POK11 protein, partial [Vireo altiloquus]|nr:POK11 protein [Vireo altiloquus]
YHWWVLPQGMKNSPTICQWYVSNVLSPVRTQVREAIILHYMDDVLVSAPDNNELRRALDLTIIALQKADFELQQEKVQRLPPWKYLGLQISNQTVAPQKVQLADRPKTLQELHQLCEQLQWIRPWVGIPPETLDPLFQLLKGGEELDTPKVLTPEAKNSTEYVNWLISHRQVNRCHPKLDFKFIVMGTLPHLHGLIFQWDKDEKDPLLIIEWVFLSHQRPKSITRPQELMAQLISKARLRLRTLAGFTKETLEQLLRENKTLQFALDSYPDQISIHCPDHKFFNANFNLIPKDRQSQKPLRGALTVFTDGSGGSHKSVMTWKDPRTQQWETDEEIVEGSPQVAELATVIRAFDRFPEPLNLVTDSAYVAGVVSRAENSVLGHVSNPVIFDMLSKLVYIVSHREHPYYVMHVRSHSGLPGFIAQGNSRADALATPVSRDGGLSWYTLPVELEGRPSLYQQAVQSHRQFHQKAPGLVREFHLRRDEAKAIVASCPECNPTNAPSLGSGVNPRGLGSCEVWQTDVTHVTQFGRLKYVHVSVDTFSGAIYAFAHTGERALDAKKHLIQAFSFMSIPSMIKTDNGPAYTSKVFGKFLRDWGIQHRTGIPHSPTG